MSAYYQGQHNRTAPRESVDVLVRPELCALFSFVILDSLECFACAYLGQVCQGQGRGFDECVAVGVDMAYRLKDLSQAVA